LKKAISDADVVVAYGRGKPDIHYLKAAFGDDYAEVGLEAKFFDMQLGMLEKIYSRDVTSSDRIYLNPLALIVFGSLLSN